MSKYCDNCKFKKRVPFSNAFKCTKYNEILSDTPALKTEACQKAVKRKDNEV